MECKRQGNVCVTVANGTPCLGPVVHTGCGVLCPSFDRGCYGCFGPREKANTAALADHARAQGMTAEEARRWFRMFTAWADPFRTESDRHD